MDIDALGRFGFDCPLAERQYAVARTFRFRYDDKAQRDGQVLKRWWDFMILRKTFRRGVAGWRVVYGTYDRLHKSRKVDTPRQMMIDSERPHRASPYRYIPTQPDTARCTKMQPAPIKTARYSQRHADTIK